MTLVTDPKIAMAIIDQARNAATRAWNDRCTARNVLDATPVDFGNPDPYLDALAAYKEAVRTSDALAAYVAGALWGWHLQNGTPLPIPVRP